MADEFHNPDSPQFKFKELRTYSSTEWLADNKKKYRQVFDRLDTSYIYAEFSFYNKWFDVADWDLEISLRCYFSVKKGRKEICDIPIQKRISKFDAVVYIREGWGNMSDGVFWKKGTYYWEAWVGGEKVADTYFYIEESGRDLMFGDREYLELQSIRLYEGSFDDVPEESRTYVKSFDSEETRYVYAELILKNLNPSKFWQCELFVKFFNDARELKGHVLRLQRVERKDDLIHVTAGWGSNVKGSWRSGHYTAELVFMDKLLAVVPFTVGQYFEEGSTPVWLPEYRKIGSESGIVPAHDIALARSTI